MTDLELANIKDKLYYECESKILKLYHDNYTIRQYANVKHQHVSLLQEHVDELKKLNEVYDLENGIKNDR